MSLATNIKEFADVLHNIYAQQLSSLEGTDIASDGVLPLAINRLGLLQQACLYGATSIGSGFLYLLSFGWLRDFSYLPLISPEIGNESWRNHDTFLSEPFSYLFSFAKNGVSLSGHTQGTALQENLLLLPGPTGMPAFASRVAPLTRFLKTDQLVAGVVNSFFFSLPFSLPHLISLRRMFSQGVAAAGASVLGTVLAHSLFVVGVIYGVRFCVVPYYSLEPLTFLVGLVTIAIVITEFVKEKRVYLVPLTHLPSLAKIGVLSFTLTVCESTTVFHDLHHLTLNQQVSYLQLYESRNNLDSFLINTVYCLAFTLGHALFSFGFCYVALKMAEKLCSLTGWTLPQTARRINRGLLVTVLALTLSCFPYYGLDYLFTKSAGFLPEDPAYRNTIFSPTQVRSRNRHFKSRAPATKDSKTPLELDVNYFDRGMYLAAPKEEKSTLDPAQAALAMSFDPVSGQKNSEAGGVPQTVATYDPSLTFEELNYQGESAWLMRHERARRVPEEQDSKKPSIFQQPKSHFQRLRLEQDTKQAQAALRESSQIGAVSEWREGGIPGETARFYEQGQGAPLSLSPSRERHPSLNPKLYNQDLYQNDNPRGFVPEGFRYGKVQDKRAVSKGLAFEREIASSYEKSFASPFGEESDGTPPDLLPVENIIKKRYRLNPVYRALLQTDIDLFIARQPDHYKITQNQEANLFKKRQLLERYYNSIRYYSPVESATFTKRHVTELEDPHLPLQSERLQPGLTENGERTAANPGSRKQENPNGSGSLSTPPFTKSFVEAIYHQQFKGTLSTVKRFFKLTFDDEQNPNRNRILAYDQLLYKNRDSALSFPKTKSERFGDTTSDEKDHPSLHEELDVENISPFIEESNSAPIYAGWDEKARRFVITNRFNLID